MSTVELQSKLADAEERVEELEEEMHGMATRLKTAEANLKRSKAEYQTLETKKRTAESAAAERVAELEEALASAQQQPQQHAGRTAADAAAQDSLHELWEMTAQCVVASYKQRLIDERARGDEFFAILRDHVHVLSGGGQDQHHPAPGSEGELIRQRVRELELENRRLREAVADMSALRDVAHGPSSSVNTTAPGASAASGLPATQRLDSAGAKLEVLRLTEELEDAKREAAHFRDVARKHKSRAKDLEVELASLYRQGIQAREALLAEVADQQAASSRVVDEHLRRNTAASESQSMKLQNRVAELEALLGHKNQSLALAEQRLQHAELTRAYQHPRVSSRASSPAASVAARPSVQPKKPTGIARPFL